MTWNKAIKKDITTGSVYFQQCVAFITIYWYKTVQMSRIVHSVNKEEHLTLTVSVKLQVIDSRKFVYN